MRLTRLSLLILITLMGILGCSRAQTPTPTAHIRLPTPTAIHLPTLTWTPRPKENTPAPHRSPQPTPTPSLQTPTPPLAPYGWVRPLSARLRKAPSTDADTIALIPGGTTVQILGRLEQRPWYRVRVLYLDRPPQEGWMAQSVIITFASSDDIPVISASQINP